MSRSRRAPAPRDVIRPRRREREHWLLKHEREQDEHREKLHLGMGSVSDLGEVSRSLQEPPE
jgi:hypothetical protein